MSYFKHLLIVLSALLLSACGNHDENVIKVGTVAGPETKLMEVAKQVAKKKYGLKVKIVQFTDYAMPNIALNDGSIDVNMTQHLPYLEETVKAKGFKLAPIGKTFIYPMGLYSNKIKSLADLPKSATVAIPNDPSNGARALLLLEQAGLIKLNPGVADEAKISDIILNPKDINIKELDAAGLPRVLPDVDLAAINTNYAMLAGLLPSRDALAVENKSSPYANIIATRLADRNNPKLLELVKAFQSQPVLDEAKKLFQGQAIPAWK